MVCTCAVLCCAVPRVASTAQPATLFGWRRRGHACSAQHSAGRSKASQMPLFVLVRSTRTFINSLLQFLWTVNGL